MKILMYVAAIVLVVAALYMVGKIREKNNEKKLGAEARTTAVDRKSTSQRLGIEKKPTAKVSYGPKIDPIVAQADDALLQMSKLYANIKDEDVRSKINGITLVTDKIKQAAIEDESKIPQIKKFFSYYLPTTVKLLDSFLNLEKAEIEGETIGKTKNSIKEMLDVASAAFEKRLDSMFEDQALDVETDIDVMNQLLAREGLTEQKKGI